MTQTRILLIEKDDKAVASIERALSRFAVQLDVIADTARAIEEAGTGVDVVLIRAELPEVSGYLICNRLKKNPRLGGIPIVLFSSDAGESSFTNHGKLKTRADGYLKYPFEPEALENTIQSLKPLSATNDKNGARPAQDAPHSGDIAESFEDCSPDDDSHVTIDDIEETDIDIDNLLAENMPSMDLSEEALDFLQLDDDDSDDDLDRAIDQALIASLEGDEGDAPEDDLDIDAIMEELESMNKDFDDGAGGEVDPVQRYSRSSDGLPPLPPTPARSRMQDAELAGARARAQAMEATIANLKARLQSQKEEASREAASLRQEQSSLQSQLIARNKTIEGLRSETEKARKSSMEETGKLRARLEKAVSTLESNRHALAQAQEAARQNQTEAQRLQQEHRTELERLAREQRSQMAALIESHSEALTRERRKMEAELSGRHRRTIDSALARLKEESSTLRSQKEEREKLLLELKRAHDRSKARWESEKSTLLKELEKATGRASNAEVIVQELKGRFHDIKSGQAGENESLRQDLEAARQRIRSLEREITVNGQQTEELNRQLMLYRERSLRTMEKAKNSEKARQKAIRAVRIAMSLLDEGGSGRAEERKGRNPQAVAAAIAEIADLPGGDQD